MGFLNVIKSIFGFEGVGETTLKIVDKISGTDWTPQDKADFILKHAEVTKYQSPTRRLLAIIIALQWFLMVSTWGISSIIGRFWLNSHALLLAKDVETFMTLNINTVFLGVMSFYFLIGVKK
jgi:hypothetical protein